jgi:hypothetical protein
MAIEGDPDRGLRGARELDRHNGFHAEPGLGAEAAADMVGDHAHLAGWKLVALDDRLGEVVYGLGRDMNREAVAIEARDRGVRLEAGVRLRADAEGRFDQQRIARLARPLDPALRLSRLEREHGRRPAHIALPRRRSAGALRHIAGLLAVGLVEDDGSIVPAGGVQPDRGRHLFADDADCADSLERGLAAGCGHGRDRRADIAHHAILRQQRGDRRDAGNRARRRKVQPGDLAVRDVGAQDHAFELPIMADVDGVARRTRHLGAGLDARRTRFLAVEAAGTGIRHRAKNAVIGAAAAQMPRQRRADLLARGSGRAVGGAPAIVECGGLDDEARRAEPALQAIMRHEGLLDRMQLAFANAFDRRHRLVGRGLRGQEAACHRRAVEQYGAGAADAGAAHELGPGQAEAVADDVDQKLIAVVGKGRRPAVDRGAAHVRSPGLKREAGDRQDSGNVKRYRGSGAGGCRTVSKSDGLQVRRSPSQTVSKSDGLQVRWSPSQTVLAP